MSVAVTLDELIVPITVEYLEEDNVYRVARHCKVVTLGAKRSMKPYGCVRSAANL